MFQGLQVAPCAKDSVVGMIPNSGIVLLPKTVSPVESIWSVNSPFLLAGLLATARLPNKVGSPFTSVLSFTKVGTPANAPLPE